MFMLSSSLGMGGKCLEGSFSWLEKILTKMQHVLTDNMSLVKKASLHFLSWMKNENLGVYFKRSMMRIKINWLIILKAVSVEI